MRISRVARLVTITAAPFALAVAGGSASMAHAQAPSPGEPCSALHQTTQDDSGQTMWCNPTMTGSHSLVWQYGGPA